MTRLDIVFSPLMDGWLIGASVALGLATVALLWWRGGRRIGALARLLALGVLTLAVLDPQLRKEKRQPLKDIAVVVTDLSASQGVGGRKALARRAEALLRQRLGGLENLQVRFAALPEEDAAEGTKLIGALREALADVPPGRFAGAVLITDGQVHDMPERAASALPPGYEGPVHVLIDGRKNERDRRVEVLQAARYGIVGKEQVVRFRIAQKGGRKGPARVRIRVDGKARGSLNAPAGRTVRLKVRVEHAGQNIVEIIADPMPGGEIDLANNRAVIVIKGVRDRLKVLLISGEPHPGERTWRNLLKADPSVELVHFTILRPPEKQDGTPIRELALIAFPTRELFVEKLKSFDLIIFDRYQRRAILPAAYMANVARYVREGGAVLLTAGPEYAGVYSLYNSGLGDVIPARPSGGVLRAPFRPGLTELGRRHPVTRELSGAGEGRWGRWYRLVEARPDKGAQVLMSGPEGRPLLTLARRGKGRIATLLSDHIWLWARKHDGGGPDVELLRRLAHWLMKEPDLEEEALEGRAEGGGLLVTRRTMAETPPVVEATGPDGQKRRIALARVRPGVWQGKLADAPAGLYRLKSGPLERLAAVGGAGGLEMRALTATEAILAPLARATGGAVRWIASGDGVSVPRFVKVAAGGSLAGGGWLGLRAAGASRLVAVERVALFSLLPMLALALGLLAFAWWAERR